MVNSCCLPNALALLAITSCTEFTAVCSIQSFGYQEVCSNGSYSHINQPVEHGVLCSRYVGSSSVCTKLGHPAAAVQGSSSSGAAKCYSRNAKHQHSPD